MFIWEWKEGTVLAQESKIVSVYMTYVQGMSNQFEINVISACYNMFWNQFDKFFKRSWFFLLPSEKKKAIRFLFAIFWVINISWFFDDHGTWLLLLEYFWWFSQVSEIFERLFSCCFVVPISLTRKYRKKHTHHTVFLWEIVGKVFSWTICFCNSVLE